MAVDRYLLMPLTLTHVLLNAKNEGLMKAVLLQGLPVAEEPAPWNSAKQHIHVKKADPNKPCNAGKKPLNTSGLQTSVQGKHVRPINPGAGWKITALQHVNPTKGKDVKGMRAHSTQALKGNKEPKETAGSIPVRGRIPLQAISSLAPRNAPGQHRQQGHPQTGLHVSRLHQAARHLPGSHLHSHRVLTGAGQAIHHQAARHPGQQPVRREAAHRQGAEPHHPEAALLREAQHPHPGAALLRAQAWARLQEVLRAAAQVQAGAVAAEAVAAAHLLAEETKSTFSVTNPPT